MNRSGSTACSAAQPRAFRESEEDEHGARNRGSTAFLRFSKISLPSQCGLAEIEMEGGVSIRKCVPILADHGTENGALLVDSILLVHFCEEDDWG